MGLFSKIFGRKKPLEIVLKPEEAIVPEPKEEAPAPEPVIEPEVDDINAADTETAEPEQAVEEVPTPEPEPLVAAYSIYASLPELEDAPELMRSTMIERFRTLSEDENGFNGTLRDGADVDVTISKAQTGPLIMRYGEGAEASKELLSGIMMQLSLFNISVQLGCRAKTEEKLAKCRELAFALAEALKGYVEVSGALYTREGKLLIDAHGNSELESFRPEIVPPKPIDPNDERARRSATQIEANLPGYSCNLHTQVTEENVSLRAVNEIIARASALFACVITASAYATKTVAAPANLAQSAQTKLNEQYGINDALTRKEKEYLKNPVYHTGWLMRSESCAVLLWALGFMELEWPSQPADVKQLAEILKSSDTARLSARVRMRSLDEIMDMQDLCFRLHSICVRSDVSEQKLSEDAVYERHYALNWLLGVGGITDWDNVIPKT